MQRPSAARRALGQGRKGQGANVGGPSNAPMASAGPHSLAVAHSVPHLHTQPPRPSSQGTVPLAQALQVVLDVQRRQLARHGMHLLLSAR